MAWTAVTYCFIDDGGDGPPPRCWRDEYLYCYYLSWPEPFLHLSSGIFTHSLILFQPVFLIILVLHLKKQIRTGEVFHSLFVSILPLSLLPWQVAQIIFIFFLGMELWAHPACMDGPLVAAWKYVVYSQTEWGHEAIFIQFCGEKGQNTALPEPRRDSVTQRVQRDYRLMDRQVTAEEGWHEMFSEEQKTGQDVCNPASCWSLQVWGAVENHSILLGTWMLSVDSMATHISNVRFFYTLDGGVTHLKRSETSTSLFRERNVVKWTNVHSLFIF